MLKAASVTVFAVGVAKPEYTAIPEQPEHKDQNLKFRSKVMEKAIQV